MKISISIIMISLFFLASCGGDEGDYYPKPRGYMRLDFPERSYEIYSPDSCPYQFEIPEYFAVIDKSNCSKTIIMDRFNAELYLTYQPIDSNLLMNIEYSRKLAYDHSIKADAIEEVSMIDPRRRAYGLKYNIKGDAASPYQFYVTDSTDHFLRGALYFNVKPNYDSIRTSLEYITEDLDNILETIHWQ
ncbi:MAG: gliding motility lipoprotein GldD [Crocinitomix sp.]|nr:gliding motility lipoprotein GldD [Crocinitomix sp.]